MASDRVWAVSPAMGEEVWQELPAQLDCGRLNPLNRQELHWADCNGDMIALKKIQEDDVTCKELLEEWPSRSKG